MTHTTSDYDYIFKLILIGDSGVGKSCLLTRFADETYHDATLSTIGVDFKFRNVTLADKTVKLQVWDTAGQEKFRTIVASYYRGAHGILLAYDTTNAASFENLGYWLQEVKRFGSLTCPVVLVGTKTDLKSKRVVPEEAVRAFAEQYCGGANTLVETSAKTNEGVEQAFQLLAQQVFKQRVNVDMEPPRQVPRSLLQPTPDDSTARCGTWSSLC